MLTGRALVFLEQPNQKLQFFIEERRKELAKLAKAESENAKISIRTARKDANTEIKNSEASEDVQKNYEIDIQNLTDQYITRAEQIFSLKEKEILTV